MKEYSPIVPHCFNETDRLRQVIVGYENTFRPIKPINQTQETLYGTEDQPSFSALVPEFTALSRTLRREGVEVLNPASCPRDTGVNDQLTTRDLGFVIGKNSSYQIWLVSHVSEKRKESSVSYKE